MSSYMNGRKSAYLQIIQNCLGKLDSDSSTLQAVKPIAENEEIIFCIEQICDILGIDFDRKIYLPDILNTIIETLKESEVCGN